MWSGSRLPPIEAIHCGRASPPRGSEEAGSPKVLYGLDSREHGAKRARYDPPGYSILSRENLDLNGKILQAQSCKSASSPDR